MTKRAFQKFERRELDAYPTPMEAVEPLLWYLDDIDDFAEPCYGDGSLATHLRAFDKRCVAVGDIAARPGRDARTWVLGDYADAQGVITNPPWEAKLMMEIMAHQSAFLPSWFLIYSDWLFTHQSSDLVGFRCTDVVPIGRLKWIKGSKSVGFDNCCWIRMWKGKDPTKPAKFWPMPE